MRSHWPLLAASGRADDFLRVLTRGNDLLGRTVVGHVIRRASPPSRGFLRLELQAWSTRPSSVLSPTSFIFNFFAHFFHMYHTMNDSSGTRLQLLFDTALQSYDKQTGLKLIDNPLARQLENCHTVDSVLLVLQHQAPALTGFREDEGRIMTSLKRVVHVLHALSTSSTLGEGIGLVRLTQLLCANFLMLVL
jgi:hypothetical protein